MRGLIAGLTLVLVTRTAAAEPPRYVETKAPPLRGAIETGPWIVFANVAGYQGIAGGGRVALGALVGERWYLSVEAAATRLSLTTYQHEAIPPIDGTLARTGVNVRWIWGRVRPQAEIAIEGWVAAGVGAKLYRWNAGGRLARVDTAIGVGFSERIGPGGRFAFDCGLLVDFAGGGGGGPPRCAGPCDEPTPPVRSDLEIVDHVAFTVWW
jgi:hypothetical protein